MYKVTFESDGRTERFQEYSEAIKRLYDLGFESDHEDAFETEYWIKTNPVEYANLYWEE